MPKLLLPVTVLCCCLLLLLLLSACGDTPPTSTPVTVSTTTPQATTTADVQPTQTPYIVVVTATPVPATAIPTAVPTPTTVPTPTIDVSVLSATNTAIANVTAKRASTAKAENATSTAKVVNYANVPPDQRIGNYNDQINITITSINYISQTSQYTKAKPGYKFIVFNLAIVNPTSRGRDLSVNPLYFTLITLAGQAVSTSASGYALPEHLESVNVPVGSFANGSVTFEVPVGAIPGKLIWKDFSTQLTLYVVS